MYISSGSTPLIELVRCFPSHPHVLLVDLWNAKKKMRHPDESFERSVVLDCS
jgi:hypothetical protein